MKRLLVTILIVVAVLVAALGLAIALGGPGKAPPPMSSINDPFKNVDRRTSHRPVRAKDTAVAALRFQNGPAIRALVEKLTRINRHQLFLRRTAVRTGDDGLCCASHAWAICDKIQN